MEHFEIINKKRIYKSKPYIKLKIEGDCNDGDYVNDEKKFYMENVNDVYMAYKVAGILFKYNGRIDDLRETLDNVESDIYVKLFELGKEFYGATDVDVTEWLDDEYQEYVDDQDGDKCSSLFRNKDDFLKNRNNNEVKQQINDCYSEEWVPRILDEIIGDSIPMPSDSMSMCHSITKIDISYFDENGDKHSIRLKN